ncbi:hypothetical protein MACK_004025 [Theileria orientalis]|uniref:Uncharacterized protein n=1 Tax=Theileria orientalis TaxID=68886 RepID=A0A976SJQ2_THEOR|nr:hypothetical protein MACK_004025 [Theileria orientalis]
MDTDSLVTIRRKKSGKIKTFLKGLKCVRANKSASKSFELVKKLDSYEDVPLRDIRPIKYSQFAQTEDGLGIDETTQASLDPRPKSQEFNIDCFKKILDDNQNLHSRDILIENRRLALTRVVGIISLKISFHFNYFILKTNFRVVNNLFYDSFVKILARTINYKLILLLRSFVNLARISYYRRAELSKIFDSKELNQDPENKSTQVITRNSRRVVKLDLSCLLMCKVISTVLLFRKYKYLNLIRSALSGRYYKTVLYRPMNNIIEPLDFFLAA